MPVKRHFIDRPVAMYADDSHEMHKMLLQFKSIAKAEVRGISLWRLTHKKVWTPDRRAMENKSRENVNLLNVITPRIIEWVYAHHPEINGLPRLNGYATPSWNCKRTH